ncbi:hypothetical protein B0A48_11866 [Cryoendolithus antarcticus]|uniref:Uncharacterized protein n=1 Tax=Cryoendolithus antarcticus TaxID=1507870 RepID=A0A1V8STV1_9PEZI|nr:hypothetical protein B0A48_11866 [Cryoendolithus antarcticus]
MQGTPNGAGATPATSPNAGQPGTTAAAGTSPAGGVASPAPGTGTGQQGTTAVGGGSVGQSPSTDAGQPGSPSSAAGSASSPANAPTTAPQPTGVNPASQGEPKGTTTSAVAFTYIPPRTTSPAAVTFGTIVATQNSASNSVIGSTTLVPGGAAATFGDTSVFLVSGRSAAVVNGKTSAIVEPSSTPAVDIGGATLVAGDAAATFGVSTVALASGGTGLIVNGKTSPLAAATARRFCGGYILPGGQTVSAGGLAVGSGTIYAVGTSGGLIVNEQTATPLPGGAKSGDSVASAIMSMFGMSGASQSTAATSPGASSTAPVPYTGGVGSVHGKVVGSSPGVAVLLLAIACL